MNGVTTLGYGLELRRRTRADGCVVHDQRREAFFVKQQAVGLLRGDISHPTVVRLPSLPPTFDACNIACGPERHGGLRLGDRRVRLGRR